MKLTDSEVKVLVKLVESGPLRYSEIARKVPLSPGGLTKVLRNLQKKELIEREQKTDEYPPPVIYTLSKKGENIVGEITKRRAKEIADEFHEMYMALMEFDPDEAKKLLDELLKNVKEKE